MNYGLYLSAAGMLTNMHRQNVTANNLANVETAGFKRDLVSLVQREPESAALGRAELSSALMDRLGGGPWVGASRADLSPGPLERTGSPLDLAVEGRGFFVVQDEREGEAVGRLTRDGRLTMDEAGRLVTSVGQRPVVGAGGGPIVVDPAAAVEVDERGVVRQGQMAVGQLRVVDVEDELALRPVGGGLFAVEPQVLEHAPGAAGLVRQGFVERSNVDPIRAMLEMIETTRAIGHHGTLMQYHDQVMDRAVNVLGRVA